MANDWSGLVNTTARKYIKGASDATIRDRIVFAMLKNKGRITYNHAGLDYSWQIEHAEHNIIARPDLQQVNYSRLDAYRQLVGQWASYMGTDLMGDMEREQNKGNEALINRYAKIVPKLTKSITNKFGLDIYVDGIAAGNENRLWGFESFCGSGTTVAADKIAQPSDTYAGKSTALGNQGGSWSTGLTTSNNAAVATDWPDGTGTSEYDYLAPKLINTSSTAWANSTAWGDNCEFAIRQAIDWCTLTNGKQGGLDLITLAGNLYVPYLNRMSAKMRVITPFKDAEDLGFNGSMQQEGVGVMREYGIAANTGYGWNFDEVEMMCLTGQLFDTFGPEHDITRHGWVFGVTFYGNMKFENPKAFCKFFPYA